MEKGHVEAAVEQLGDGLFAAGMGLATRQGGFGPNDPMYSASVASLGSMQTVSGSAMPQAPIGIGSTGLGDAHNAPRPASLHVTAMGSIPSVRPVSPLQAVQAIQTLRGNTGPQALPELSGSQVNRGFREGIAMQGGGGGKPHVLQRRPGKLLKGGTRRPPAVPAPLEPSSNGSYHQGCIHSQSTVNLTAAAAAAATVGRSQSAEILTLGLEGGLRGRGGSSAPLLGPGPTHTHTRVAGIPMIEQDPQSQARRAYSPLNQSNTGSQATGGIPPPRSTPAASRAGSRSGSRANTPKAEQGMRKAEDAKKEKETHAARVRRERREKFGSVAKSSLSSRALELSGGAIGGGGGGVGAPVSVESLTSMEGMAADREQRKRKVRPPKGALAAIGKKKREAIAALQVGSSGGGGVAVAGAVVPLRGLRSGLRESSSVDPHLQPGVGTNRTLAADRFIAQLPTLL